MLRARIVIAILLTTSAALAGFGAAIVHFSADATPSNELTPPPLVGPALIALVIMLVLAVPLSGLALRSLRRSVLAIAGSAPHIAYRGDAPTAGWHEEELRPLAAALSEMATAARSQVAAVETEHARLAAILTHMGDGVIMIDAENRIGLINAAAARLLATTPDEAEGRSLVDVARDHELVAAARAALAGNATDLSLLLEMGQPRRTVQIVATAVPPETPGQARALLLLQDVTDLRHAETIRREFVANVSHELRTPVASLKALVETLDSGALEDPPAARLFLARMLLETDRLAQLVEELLELALLESGAARLDHQPIDVAALIPRAAERLRTSGDQHGVKLIVTTCPEGAAMLGDAVRLERVLINLLDNAVKFTAPGGEVSLRCEILDDRVLIAVTDTGSGIPAQDLARVFERFYKADRARSSAGTGLGLAIAKHTVEAHGGRIWAESVEGHGSTFYVSLPTAMDRRAATSRPVARQP